MHRDAIQETVLAVEVFNDGYWSVRFSDPPFTRVEAESTAKRWRDDGFAARIVEYRRIEPSEESIPVEVSLHTREPRPDDPGSEVCYPGYSRRRTVLG